MSHLEGDTRSRGSPSAVVRSLAIRLDLETSVIPLERDVLGAGRVCPSLKEFPLVTAELEQVTDDCVDLQGEVTCLDVTEMSSVILVLR